LLENLHDGRYRPVVLIICGRQPKLSVMAVVAEKLAETLAGDRPPDGITPNV
jgi:hypothetical protein